MSAGHPLIETDDQGGAVAPRRDCPHVAKACGQHSVDAFTRALDRACAGCGEDDPFAHAENWMCMFPGCGTVACSRYVRQHMLAHHDESGHPIILSLCDLNTWCYLCDSYIVSPETTRARVHAYVAKHGKLPADIDSSALQDPEAQAEADQEVAAAMARITAAKRTYPEPRRLTPNREHFADEVGDGDSGEGNAAQDADDTPDPLAVDDDPADSLITAVAGQTNFGHARKEDVWEFLDSPETTAAKARQVAQLIRRAQHVVVHTGAGISVAAKIPCYRGPKGVWTLAAQGKRAKMPIALTEAQPTRAHMALCALVKAGLVSHIISTNVDGLHARALAQHTDDWADSLSELHGNVYVEACVACGSTFLRDYDVTRDRAPPAAPVPARAGHETGRPCDACGSDLTDTIINFGEPLNPAIATDAVREANACDLAIVLGSSLRVQPACGLVDPAWRRAGHARDGDQGDGDQGDGDQGDGDTPWLGGGLVVVNLQKTPYDERCQVRPFAKCDDFMDALMDELGLEIPAFDASHPDCPE